MNYTIFWFRRDLRLTDNKGLYYALKQGNVLPIFIFDNNITAKLPSDDARIEFIHQSIKQIEKTLSAKGKGIKVFSGDPAEIVRELIEKLPVRSVVCNMDHEPYGIERDEHIKEILESSGIQFSQFLDHLLFQKREVLKDDGTPYQVFTPFSKKCLTILSDDHLYNYPSEELISNFVDQKENKIPDLKDLRFSPSGIVFSNNEISEGIIGAYDQTRNIPSVAGTSRLGLHLRFGTISIRKLARIARNTNAAYLNELLWREFFAIILWHFPRVVSEEFKPQYSRILWRNNPDEFELWKNGETGFPIVDAGMRELSETGYMHNRVRMITASFLTKHLLIDWRWGEAWFALKLLDFELSNNNGNWQWAAGCGCDAAPYFRIFNPEEQQKKFDKEMSYIKKWVPEVLTAKYPKPIVNHKFARERCLNAYKTALDQ